MTENFQTEVARLGGSDKKEGARCSRDGGHLGQGHGDRLVSVNDED